MSGLSVGGPRAPAAAMTMGAVEATAPPSRERWISHWMDCLKHEGVKPSFDVLEKTKQFVEARNGDASFYANDYVFRGSLIGPISREDVERAQESFSIIDAYPDLDRGAFGFTIDPNNPFRCMFFERWTATNTGRVTIGDFVDLPPTNKRVELPMHVTSICWNPDGKIVYQCISPPLDRFEGNTKGTGAVFGLLRFAGSEASKGWPGDPWLILLQKLVSLTSIVPAAPWSKEVPAWWKSSARGAELNDI